MQSLPVILDVTKLANFWLKNADASKRKRSVARDLDFFG